MSKEKKDLRRQWPTGELTEAVIKKAVQTDLIPSAIVYTVAAVLFCVVVIPVFMTATTLDLRSGALLVGMAFCAVMAYQRWSNILTRREFRIEEDRILSKRIEADIQKKDARQSDLSTRVPILEMEKHGPYQIDAEQIHSYYIPLQLYHEFQEQEEVYMVYDKKTNKLLRLYRKKYWTLPDGDSKTEEK